jgi:hypothetical protein
MSLGCVKSEGTRQRCGTKHWEEIGGISSVTSCTRWNCWNSKLPLGDGLLVYQEVEEDYENYEICASFWVAALWEWSVSWHLELNWRRVGYVMLTIYETFFCFIIPLQVATRVSLLPQVRKGLIEAPLTRKYRSYGHRCCSWSSFWITARVRALTSVICVRNTPLVSGPTPVPAVCRNRVSGTSATLVVLPDTTDWCACFTSQE